MAADFFFFLAAEIKCGERYTNQKHSALQAQPRSCTFGKCYPQITDHSGGKIMPLDDPAVETSSCKGS